MDSDAGSNTWKTVPYRKKQYKKRPVQNLGNSDIHTESESDHPLSFHLEQIASYTLKLLQSDFFDKLCAQLLTILEYKKGSEGICFKEIVCYGLGSPTNSYSAAFQLSLLIILRHILQRFYSSSQLDVLQFKNEMLDEFKPSPIVSFNALSICSFVYDPVLSNSDVMLLSALGFDIIEENENGKRSSSNTVFVMIHCDKFLYNNLLWKNWALVNLTEMILIGNSFGSMFERHPHRILKDHYKYIWLIHELAVYEENVVENWTERDNVFNDQAITVFPRKKCTTIDFPSIKNSGSPIYEKSCLF